MESSDHLVKIGREGFDLIDACNNNKRRLVLRENLNYFTKNKEEAPVVTMDHREAALKYQGVTVEQRYYYMPEPKPKPRSRWSVFFQAFKF